MLCTVFWKKYGFEIWFSCAEGRGHTLLRGGGTHRAGPKVVKGEKKVSPYTHLLRFLLASYVVQHTSLAFASHAGARLERPAVAAQALESAAPSFKYTRSGFLRAMSDAGLKPTVVYHNLTPPELYEKVLRLCLGPLTLPIRTVWGRGGQLQCAHVTEHSDASVMVLFLQTGKCLYQCIP